MVVGKSVWGKKCVICEYEFVTEILLFYFIF